MEALITRLINFGLFKYLGVGAIGIAIWYTGPYIPFLKPVTNRLIAIGIFIVLYLLFLLIRKLIAKRKDQGLSDDLAANADSAADASEQRTDEEIATLKEKFDEALDVLRKSSKGKKKVSSLYALPWYMVIGPPGAGKTTLLVNSGLKFPLAEKMGLSKLQGVGGTRFCDWWFTDEAVIVDTAGRYTTQDSDEEVDNAAWLGFLKLLKKNRKRRPISGIVVAVSMDELTRQSEVDRERHAVAVTQRIQELYEQLGVRFPVYVMFTKCDLMSGFMEFYGDLDRHQREQVWGTTFAVADKPGEKLGSELHALQGQLEARLVQRLQQERDPQRRNLIYNFPSLFNSARPLVTEFIDRVFKPSRYTVTPFLRGVYFTSGTQEGTPFNRLISQLARGFSLSHASVYGGPSQGKSFFIRDLLSKVIFGESGLAGSNLKADRIYRVMRTAGLAALVVVPLALVGLWFMSSSKNKSQMVVLGEDSIALNERIKEASPQNSSLMSVLPILDQSRALTFGYAQQQESPPLSMRFGLYQGGRLSRNLTIPAYKNVLENAFLSRLMVRMEQQLKASMNSPELSYQALKAYLMLGDPERLDPAYLKRWITTDWQKNFGASLTRDQLEQLTLHLDALLDLQPLYPPFDLDNNLVESVRGVLAQTSHAQRAYAMIKAELLTEGEDFSVAAAGGPDARMALIRVSGEPFSRGVPFMFSPDGYYKSFIPAQARVIDEQEDEFWIFGTNAAESAAPDSSALTAQVSNLYFRDYIQTWWAFLEDVRVRPFNNHQEAAEILRIITGDESPLVLVLQGAAAKTKLMPDLPVGGNEEAAASVMQTVGDPSVVDREFRTLHGFVIGQGDQPSPLDGVKRDVAELAYLVSILARGGTGPETAGTQKDVGKAVNKIRYSAANAPEPMNDWIKDVADQSNGLVAGRRMSNLNAQWRAEIVPFCQKAIANRYPFSPDSDTDVALSDFGQFFGPGGKMDKFFEANLASDVNTNTTPWRVHGGSSSVVRVSSAALAQMRLAREIQKSFFSQGGTTPATSFDLTPFRMDANTTHFTLNIYGQRVSYDHGAAATETLMWPPGNSSFNQVQMQFSPPTAKGGSRTESGDWAWFRLLDNASPEAGNSPEEFRLTFRLDDRWIIYDLRARSAFNPFNLSQLRSFRCVSNL